MKQVIYIYHLDYVNWGNLVLNSFRLTEKLIYAQVRVQYCLSYSLGTGLENS